MKKLSRDEMKKVLGGYVQDCTSSSQCGNKERLCGDVIMSFSGNCYANTGATQTTCHWGGCPY